MIGAVMYVISTGRSRRQKFPPCFPDANVRYAEARIYDRRDCKHDNLFRGKKIRFSNGSDRVRNYADTVGIIADADARTLRIDYIIALTNF